MSIADKVFAGSIPEFYDAYLVPLIFESVCRRSRCARQRISSAGRSRNGGR